ncbi:hypothetical protein DZB84_15455 [Bacillus sp. HNG]|uniref:hypothetical protein n=1 Tax=Bacillus sp. HNG TaxID=2293325 RepID=UPI000E2F6336|nr:hypothetical protein [Bacillus sp. HNG]RFB14826.1 hypothetical protein DZB84_15455 [Bacillus sp. HNG]
MSEKRITIFISALVLLFFSTLLLSKPSPQEFNEWLASKHDIECVGDDCVLKNSKQTVVDRTINDYILLNKMGVILEDEEGRRTLIEGLGTFGTFTTFTYNPGYSPIIDLYKK